MTMTTTAMIGSHERTAYTVEHRGDCVLITGAIPALALPVLAKLVPEGSVMDPDVARIWGATLAFGLPEDLQELREAGEVVAMQRERPACAPSTTATSPTPFRCAATPWATPRESTRSSSSQHEPTA